MFNRSAFLGQVQIRGLGQAQMRAGTGFMGPFGIYSDLPHPAGNAPAGFPASTVEEMQTYICPDGSRQEMTRQEAIQNACVLANPGAYVLGQASGPSSPGTGSAPAGTPAGNAIANAGQPTFARPSDLFAPSFAFPGYPGYYPPPPPNQGKLVCKKVVDADGNETFECEPKPQTEVVAATYRYPVYFMNPFFF